jgi:uncharacterized membrane-anchored protein
MDLLVRRTFALGTAVGDLSALTLHLGYLLSGVLFAVVLTLPALGYRRFRWGPIFSFWAAYVLTRPLGASLADWMGKSSIAGGLGLGAGWVSLAFTVLIAALVGYLAVTRRDVQSEPQEAGSQG